jgi:hypothetical protein
MRKHPTAIAKDAADAGDIVWGVDGPSGIAAAIGRTPQQTYYLISKGKLPVRKHGHKTYSASRSRLHAHLAGEIPELG